MEVKREPIFRDDLEAELLGSPPHKQVERGLWLIVGACYAAILGVRAIDSITKLSSSLRRRLPY